MKWFGLKISHSPFRETIAFFFAPRTGIVIRAKSASMKRFMIIRYAQEWEWVKL